MPSRSRDAGGAGPGVLYASLTARGANRLATETLSLAVPLLVHRLTGSLAWSGLVMLLEWLPRIVGIPVAGPLVDRYGSRRCLRVAETCRVALLGVALAVVLAAPGAWWVLIGASMTAGALGQASFVAVEKLGVELGAGRPVHRVQSLQAATDHATLVVAPLAAGVLAVGGSVPVVAVVLGLALACRVLLRWLPDVPPAPAHRRNTAHRENPVRREDTSHRGGTAWRRLTAGLRLVRRDPALVHLTATTAAFNLLLAVTVAVTPALVRREYGHGSVHVSVVWAVGGALSLVFIAAVTRIAPRAGMPRVGLVSGLLAASAVAAAAWAPGYAAYLVLVGGFMALDGAFACFLRTLRAQLIPLADFGVTVSAMVLLVLVPYPVAGLLVAVVPYGAVPALLCATAAGTALVMVVGIRALTARTAEPARVAAPATVPVARGGPPGAAVDRATDRRAGVLS
jgi:MFS family permease